MPMASHFNQANHSGKSILARAARLFYSRRGRRTNMILYSLFIIIYKTTKQKSPAAGLAA